MLSTNFHNAVLFFYTVQSFTFYPLIFVILMNCNFVSVIVLVLYKNFSLCINVMYLCECVYASICALSKIIMMSRFTTANIMLR